MIDANRFTQLHYYATGYNVVLRLVACREAGEHGCTRQIELEQFASDDVHLLTTDDGTPVWGY